MAARQVAITGLGAVTAIGGTAVETWRAMCEGVCGIGPVTLFDTRGLPTGNAAQVPALPVVAEFEPRLRKRATRADLLAVAAADEALADAGIEIADLDPATLGIAIGTGAGGLLETEAYWFERLERGIGRARLSRAWGFFPSTTTDVLAARYGCEGPSTTIMTACSSSTLAIGLAADQVRTGSAEVMIAGGSEALCRVTFAGFCSLRAVDPDRCRPFDLERKGMSLGEGAGILILEELDRARRRGARIHGVLAGFGGACDAHHVTAPDPTGDGAARTMLAALADAGISTGEIDYVSAHGTGTPFNDEAETRALHTVFGARARKIPVSSVKSMVGHCLGAAGAIEAVALVQTVRDGVLPPTVGLTTPDPACDLDYVPVSARRVPVRSALSSSFAFGGNNGALVVTRAAP